MRASTSRLSAAAQTSDWRLIATADDRRRLARVRLAWTSALASARRAEPAEIAADPALFDPDRALADPLPPPGGYRCRTVKLGAQSVGGLGYVAYPFFACRIGREGQAFTFTKLTGSQRPAGRIFPADSIRAIFLGTLLLGDETIPTAYGRDAMRDMAGEVERIGPSRWRLVLPYPHYESQLDLIELVPATG